MSSFLQSNDPSVACFVQMTVGLLKQVHDGVSNSNPMMMSKLQWVLEGACLVIQVS